MKTKPTNAYGRIDIILSYVRMHLLLLYSYPSCYSVKFIVWPYLSLSEPYIDTCCLNFHEAYIIIPLFDSMVVILNNRAIYWMSHIVQQAANVDTACFAIPSLCTHLVQYIAYYSRVSFCDGVTFSNIWL